LRVLHLTRDLPPRARGGISTAVGASIEALLAAGLEVAAISLDRGGPAAGGADAAGPARVLRIAGPADSGLARRWAAQPAPAVVHVHDPLLWPLGADIAADAGAGTVLTTHVLAGHQDRLRGLETATRSARAQAEAIAAASAVIAPSIAASRLLRAEFPDAAVTALPLALPDPGPPPARTRGGPPRALFVGRFSDMTGVDVLVEMLPALAGAVPGLELVVAGGLPENRRTEERWRQALAEAARRSGVALGLRGWLEGAALEAEYLAADVLVAPARFATFGFAVLEAMLRGVPAVATAVGGHLDLIIHPETGRLAEPGDPVALAGEVAALMNDRAARWRCGKAARDRALDRFSPATRTPALVALYERLTDSVQ
jgi:glycosyltransferase involved in cell wall biosynthesis